MCRKVLYFTCDTLVDRDYFDEFFSNGYWYYRSREIVTKSNFKAWFSDQHYCLIPDFSMRNSYESSQFFTASSLVPFHDYFSQDGRFYPSFGDCSFDDNIEGVYVGADGFKWFDSTAYLLGKPFDFSVSEIGGLKHA